MEPEAINLDKTKLNPEIVSVLSPSEKYITTIHQHVIVLLKYGFFTILACLVFLASSGVIVKSITVLDAASIRIIIMALAAITIFFMSIVLYVIAMAYSQTVLVITDESVVEVQQKGLLFHKVGRLSMADVEDVSSEQRGIWPRILGYGGLTIQTAGEMPNFIFKYCPNPVHMTEIINKARDKYNVNEP